MKQSHPFQGFIRWLESLPPDHRAKVSTIILLHMPPLADPVTGYAEDGGVNYLKEWLSTDQKPHLVIGKVLILRAIINYTCRDSFEKEGQQLHDIHGKQIIESLVEQGHEELAQKLKHSAEQSPLRNAHWSKAAELWKHLLATDFSDAALKAYEIANPPFSSNN